MSQNLIPEPSKSFEPSSEPSSKVPSTLITLSTLVVLIWGLGEARAFFIPVCIATLLAVLITPITRWLNRLHIPEWLSITLSVFLLLAPLLTAFSFLGYEIQSFIQDLPRIGKSLNELLLNFAKRDFISKFNLSSHLELPQLTERLLNSAGHGLQIVVVGVKSIFEASIQALLILILAIVMIACRHELRQSVENAIRLDVNPKKDFNVIDEIITLVEQFIITRLIIVLIVALLDFIALRAFSIEYSFVLGTFLGIMTVVPAVGFVLGVVPAIIVAISFGHAASSIVGVFICIVVVSAIESHILSPKLLGTRLNLNLLATFLGLLAFGYLWGGWGLFLGVPILGILRIILFQSPSLKRWGMLLADPKAVAQNENGPTAPKQAKA